MWQALKTSGSCIHSVCINVTLTGSDDSLGVKIRILLSLLTVAHWVPSGLQDRQNTWWLTDKTPGEWQTKHLGIDRQNTWWMTDKTPGEWQTKHLVNDRQNTWWRLIECLLLHLLYWTTVHSKCLLNKTKQKFGAFAIANKDGGAHNLFRNGKVPHIAHSMGDKGSPGR